MELGGSNGELLGVGSAGAPDETPPYQITVHARGERYSRSMCKHSESFVVQRGFVSVDLQAVPQEDNVTVDGMNEDGLTISGHTLRQSVYQDEVHTGAASHSGFKLCFSSLVPWALGSFRLVKDLTEALQNVSVVADTFLPLPSGDRLHWAVEDATGDRAVLEYLEGKLQVHQNKVGVMTNDPDYTWHLRNLNNWASIHATDPKARDIAVETAEVGSVPSVVGHGFNLWGLPGDISPPSRFVRLFYLRALTVKNRGLPSTLREGVKIIMGLLNNVWITKGTVALGDGDGPGEFEFTQYSLIKVPQKRLYHWRTYDDSQWQVMDLTQIDFDRHSSRPLYDGSDGILNVTKRFLSPSKGNAILT